MGLNMESVRAQLKASVTEGAIREILAIEHCQTCGGYKGEVNARYARHNDACECKPCALCKEAILQGDYRCQDDRGQDICTYCREAVAAEARRDGETGHGI